MSDSAEAIAWCAAAESGPELRVTPTAVVYDDHRCNLVSDGTPSYSATGVLQELVDGDRLVAVRTRSPGSQATCEDVALPAALLAHEALLALRALIDRPLSTGTCRSRH